MKKCIKGMFHFVTVMKTICIVVLFLSIALNCFVESIYINFEGVTTRGEPLPLTGILSKPEGSGPFPAIVMLHGCGENFSDNSRNLYGAWADRLKSWGYVVLQVDSFGPRSIVNTCQPPRNIDLHAYNRMFDAYSGKIYLENQSYVDTHRIAIMGWSHGGWTAHYAVNKKNLDKIKTDPFKAAIAFSPWCCQSPIQLSSPLLIIFGEKDGWVPRYTCKNLPIEEPSPYEAELKIYPDAYHLFDIEGIDREIEGNLLRYDPIAAKDAVVQVKTFLTNHLR